MKSESTTRSSLSILGNILKVIVALVVLLIPLLGVWTASSLAAYHGQASWIPIAAGLAAFPLIPLLWEAVSSWRRARRSPGRARVLTAADRLILRTLAVNLFLVTLLVAVFPRQSFTALSARGDWMLGDARGVHIDRVRKGILASAAVLEWVYELAKEDPYEAHKPKDADPDPSGVQGGIVEEGSVPKAPVDAGSPAIQHGADAMPVDAGAAPAHDASDAMVIDAGLEQDTGERQDPSGDVSASKPTWPLSVEIHPAVRSIPSDSESSIESVGAYLKQSVRDPWEQSKAVHDYVADRVAYDAPALAAGQYPPQDAETVFRKRIGVCAGYANLFVAIARKVGLEAVYLTGDVRNEENEIDGRGHAWNAVRIQGLWYLVDVTWDAGWVRGSTFTKAYRTDYFLTPPNVFVTDHFPSVDQWQLMAVPISRGEFLRQPMLRASFYAKGLKLLSPDRSMVELDTPTFQASVANPSGKYFMASVAPRGATTEGSRCSISKGSVVSVACPMPGPGVYRITLFVGEQEFGTYEGVGSLDAVYR